MTGGTKLRALMPHCTIKGQLYLHSVDFWYISQFVCCPVDGDNNAATTSNATTTSSYTSNNSYAFEDDSDRRINVYSTNYLNWKFGAKVCRSGSLSGPIITSGSMPGDAVCSPVGRKTRLQIAKDALNKLIDETGGVRFGLTVFNKLPSNNDENALRGSQGANVVFPISPMGSQAAPNTANRNALKNIINWLEAKGATPLTVATYDVYRYFRGETPFFGTNAAISANTGAAAVICSREGVLLMVPPLSGFNRPALHRYVGWYRTNPHDVKAPAILQVLKLIRFLMVGPKKTVTADTLVRD